MTDKKPTHFTWYFTKDSMPQSGERCLLVTTSKAIIAGDWYKDGWRTEWSKWIEAPEGTRLSLLPTEDVLAWMIFPELPEELKPVFYNNGAEDCGN